MLLPGRIGRVACISESSFAMRNPSSGTLERLQKRSQFLTIARTGRKAVTQGVVLQARPLEPGHETEIKVGYTASRKVGGSVQDRKSVV